LFDHHDASTWWLLLTAVTLPLAVFSVIVYITARNVNLRLRAIAANADAFAQGRSLGAPLGGNDEIAALDRAFHTMADEVGAREHVLQRYRYIVEHAQDIVFLFRRSDGRICEANAAACAVYGYSLEEFERLTLQDLRAPHKRLEPLAALDMYPASFETEHVRKGGENFTVWVRANSAEINGEQYVFSLVSDLTQRATRERELRDARDQALAATEMKSRFIATMSHEIRTPMNAIVGLTEMLMADDLGGVHAERVAMLNSAGKSLLGLVNDLLDLSRLEAGMMELREEPFALDALLADAVASVEAQATRKLLTVRTCADGHVPCGLRGDELRLRQVIVNLLSNAVKFTEKGHVELRVTRLPSAPDECLLRFDIQDTGIGMTAEERDRIFAPFSQVDSSSTRRAQGSGLGLWLCKNLVARMGGKIGVESVRGRGSTFWFTVRVAEHDQALVESLPSVEFPPQPAVRTEAGRARVLVAEDNEINQQVIAMQLDQLGYEAFVVADGMAAVDAALDGLYDLVLMDCQMPELDGFGAVARIRQAERQSNSGARLPIVAVTANASGSLASYRSSGFDDLLRKPVTLSALKTVLDRWMRPPNEECPCLDVDVLRELVGGDKSSLEQFLVRLKGGLSEVVERLVIAVYASDLPAAARIAHELKGAAASVGANDLSQRAFALEKIAKERRAEELDEAMCEVSAALGCVLQYEFSPRSFEPASSSQAS
jgi:PAS domain S-box-containing protein